MSVWNVDACMTTSNDYHTISKRDCVYNKEKGEGGGVQVQLYIARKIRYTGTCTHIFSALMLMWNYKHTFQNILLFLFYKPDRIAFTILMYLFIPKSNVLILMFYEHFCCFFCPAYSLAVTTAETPSECTNIHCTLFKS